jgi:hypothetical protein
MDLRSPERSLSAVGDSGNLSIQLGRTTRADSRIALSGPDGPTLPVGEC